MLQCLNQIRHRVYNNNNNSNIIIIIIIIIIELSNWVYE